MLNPKPFACSPLCPQPKPTTFFCNSPSATPQEEEEEEEEDEEGSVYQTLKRWNVTKFNFQCLND